MRIGCTPGLEQLEAQCLDLAQDAVQSGLIRERAAEHGVAAGSHLARTG